MSSALFADSAPIVPADGSTVIPVYDSDIILEKETINIYLRRNGFSVEVLYLFFNTGRAKDVTMGFPNYSVPTAVEPIGDFRAFDAGKELTVYRKDAKESDEWIQNYYECFDVGFGASEYKNITNTYSSYYSTNYEGTELSMTYILTTGALWNKNIESVRVNIYIDGFTQEELENHWYYILSDDLVDFSPLKFRGVSFNPTAVKVTDFYYKMEFVNIEPDFNIVIDMPLVMSRYAEASSELESGTMYSYSANNVIDNDPATSWVEGVSGNGNGEYIKIYNYYAENKFYGFCSIEKIGIINGFAENERLFFENNRVRTIRLDYSNIVNGEWIESSAIITFEDTMDMQYYTFSSPVISDSFKVSILEVYPGSKWDDTCIAEFKIFPVEVGK